MATTPTFRIWRADGSEGGLQDKTTTASEARGWLNAGHQIRPGQAHDLPAGGTGKAGRAGRGPAGATATFRIWRGDGSDGRLQDYTTTVSEGMVVLDAVHQIQAEQAHDLAVRWNCKAGKCGSCSAEVNGNPRLMCMTRLNQIDISKP